MGNSLLMSPIEIFEKLANNSCLRAECQVSLQKLYHGAQHAYRINFLRVEDC